MQKPANSACNAGFAALNEVEDALAHLKAEVVLLEIALEGLRKRMK